MNIPAFTCPECGSSHIRRSRYQKTSERFGALLGVYPFRCRECGARFLADVLMLKRLIYSKCPRCLRMELTTWSRQFYRATMRQNVALLFGAQRYRCSTCRYNFVAFRPRLKRNKETLESTEELYEEEMKATKQV